jgi:hypothetical protein
MTGYTQYIYTIRENWTNLKLGSQLREAGLKERSFWFIRIAYLKLMRNIGEKFEI